MSKTHSVEDSAAQILRDYVERATQLGVNYERLKSRSKTVASQIAPISPPQPVSVGGRVHNVNGMQRTMPIAPADPGLWGLVPDLAGASSCETVIDLRSEPVEPDGPDVWDLFDAPSGGASAEPDGPDVWDLFDAPSGGASAEPDEPDVWDLFDAPAGGALVAPAQGSPVSPTMERDLAAVLEDILDTDHVPADCDFFADLGADSLLMAQFCARVTGDDALPSISIRDVYNHPSLSELAAHLGGDEDTLATSDPTIVEMPDPPEWAGTPVSRAQHILCGLLQSLLLIAMTFAGMAAAAQGFAWTLGAEGFVNTYERAVVFGMVNFVALTTLPILAKWLLVGRWKAQYIRIWSLTYVRFWFVNVLARANPINLFAGSPLYTTYLRLLGANIGEGTVVLSRQVALCPDLFTIGDNSVVRAAAVAKCYRAKDGYIQTGPVTIGSDAFVGTESVLEIYSSLGDRAQLGHSSGLIAGQRLADGVRAVGSPASLRTDVDYMHPIPIAGSKARRLAYSTVQLVSLVAVTTPALALLPILLFQSPFAPEIVAPAPGTTIGTASLVLSVVEIASVFYFGSMIVSFVTMWLATRGLRRLFTPGTAYPLYGFRYAAHRFLGRVTNAQVFMKLFGDSSYVLHYLKFLGYDVCFEGQTGANFGVGVRHDSPFFIKVGTETMAADGLTLANSEFSSSSFMISPVTIPERSYLGNGMVYPPQARMGENCLLATKVMVPLDGDVRENVGVLGSPGFEIPRSVERDQDLEDLWSGDKLAEGLAVKNRHNIVTIVMFVLARWFGAILLLGFTTLGVVLYPTYGAVTSLAFPLAIVVSTTYNILVDRASIGFKRIRPVTCSIYESDSLTVERFWKLSWNPVILAGTPMKSVVWRLLGVKIGKRVYDDGCTITERSLVTIGDDCTLNSGSVIQSHSQEDAAFKADYIALGSGCTVGTNTLVHYGVTLGDGASVNAGSFMMKGTAVPAHTTWGENPARELDDGGTNLQIWAIPDEANTPANAGDQHEEQLDEQTARRSQRVLA